MLEKLCVWVCTCMYAVYMYVSKHAYNSFNPHHTNVVCVWDNTNDLIRICGVCMGSESAHTHTQYGIDGV